MAYSKVEQMVYDIASPIAEENGCHIYDIEYVKEGGTRHLRVFIDKDGGVSIDECEAVSRSLSVVLDKVDPIKENYFLEISSPGIERRLRTKEHFESYMGSVVDVGLYKAVNGSKQLTGELAGYEDNTITLKTDIGEITLQQGETTYVKLHFDF